MQDLIPFAFDSHAVCTLMIDDQPWFVGKDVALALGYTNPNKAISDHCDGVTKRYPIADSLGRTQEARIISEPDVFRLVMSSHLPEAKRFERWVFEEVLPALRRDGHYGTAQASAPPSELADVPRLLALVTAIRTETNADMQAMLHAKLARICQQQELPLPELAGLVTGRQVDPVPARAFWKAVQVVEAAGGRLNHARHADHVAYNLPEVRKIALAHGHRLPSNSALRRSLRGDLRFVTARPLHSARDERTVRCWVFRRRV